MMKVLAITVNVLLLINCISSNNMTLSRDALEDLSANSIKCTDANDCNATLKCAMCLQDYGPPCSQVNCVDGICQQIEPCSIYTSTVATSQCNTDAECAYVKMCEQKCPDGFGPQCAFSNCIDGQCVITKPCSQKIECTDTDVSQCVVPQVCARCLLGYGPPCTEAACENGRCKTISPCSIHTSTVDDQSSTTVATSQCKTDAECAYVKMCEQKCPDGFGPQCAFSKCIDGQCVITKPCSQKIECTDTDVSQCNVSKACASCLRGYGPPCEMAACENGRCKTIKRCSLLLESTTKIPVVDSCTRDEECPRAKICRAQCPTGTGPLCASAKCVDSKCVSIQPCSQIYCRTAAKCPYNKKNCKSCSKGYTPTCEQPVCLCGVCSVIPPCSQKITTTIPSTKSQ